ncbi:uncharacterized protein EV422DRAFT_263595 [Fimicolochytrium jonesii]|uniref:uncharacterized protein n=1 Tax=Fimicolochytrium jonesii TaxID=1396493 RepID=UPI0022FE0C5B|nr:uncharacterized protein EV422DRAFT_263595 [Fimicolochytrium jonesii]KAI8817065.1 hypothetical protein EV422DRAFT_263595 [Fimicolochytrium jonesii]
MSARSTKPVLTERQRVPPHLSSTERACTPSYPDRPLRKRSSAASTRLAEDSGYATANTTVMTAGTRRSGLSVSVGRDVGQEARKLSSGTTASTARGSLVANTTGRSRTSTTNSSITTVAATARPILKPRRVETQRLQTSISSRDGHLPPFTTTDAADIMKGRISDVTRRRMELRAVAATGCKLSSTPASHVHKSIPDVPSLNVRKSVRTRAREESREIVMESEREKERVERMQRLERLEKGKQRERELVEMQMQMEQQQIKRNAGGDVVNHETGRPAHAHKRVKSVHHYSKENRLPPAPAPASTRTHVSSIPPPSTIRASQRVKSKPKTTTYTSVSSTAPAQTRLPSAPIAHHVQHASTARPVDFKASVASYASTAGTTMRRVQKSSTSSSLSANMPSHASGHGSYSRILSETVAPSAAHTSTTSATVRSNSGGSSSAHAQQLLHQPNQKVQLHYTAPTQPTYLQTPQTQVQQDDFTFTTSYSTLFSRHIAKPTFPSSFHTASTTKTSRLRLFSNASSVNPFADRKMPGAPRCGKKDFRDLEKS